MEALPTPLGCRPAVGGTEEGAFSTIYEHTFSEEEVSRRRRSAEFRAVMTGAQNREELILLLATCLSCGKPVVRRLDTEGTVLVVGEWIHQYRSDHKVKSIYIEETSDDHDGGSFL